MSTEPKQLDTLIGWKSALGLMVSLIVAGAVGVVTITTYLDDRATEKFYKREDAAKLEAKITQLEAQLPKFETYLKTIQDQQQSLSIQMGKIEGKLDSFSK